MTRYSVTTAVLFIGLASSSLAVGCGDKQVPGGTGGSGDDSSGGTSSSSGGSSGTASSGGSSSGGSSSGRSSSGGGTSSGGGSGSGGSSGSTSSSSGINLDAAIDVAPPPLYDGGPQKCGLQSSAMDCNLKTSTCCVDQLANGTCVAHGSSCPPLNAGFGCLGKIDCTTSGQVCCGIAMATTANSSCQTVASGQPCPGTVSATMAPAQLCVTSAECTMGQQCIAQKCLAGANLRLCGLHTEMPYNCVAQ